MLLFKNVSLHSGVKFTNYASNEAPFYFSCVLLQSVMCKLIVNSCLLIKCFFFYTSSI